MMNYTATYINWLTGDLVNKCHTNRRMAQACMEYVMAKKAYQEYRISYFNAT